MGMTGLFIRRPIGVALLAIGLFVMGLICYLRLGVSALPQMEIPVIYVIAPQTGADATTMASTVTAPLERRLGQVPGISMLRSGSSGGFDQVCRWCVVGRVEVVACGYTDSRRRCRQWVG